MLLFESLEVARNLRWIPLFQGERTFQRHPRLFYLNLNSIAANFWLTCGRELGSCFYILPHFYRPYQFPFAILASPWQLNQQKKSSNPHIQLDDAFVSDPE